MLKIKKKQRYIAVLATSISVVNPKIQEIQELHTYLDKEKLIQIQNFIYIPTQTSTHMSKYL